MKSKDAREQTKLLESQFTRVAEGSLDKLSQRLEEVMVNAILESPDRHSFVGKMNNIRELNKSANGMLQLLGNQIEQCILREFNSQGIGGYNKCFLMFAKVMEWQTRTDFPSDPSIKKGISDSIKSKAYHKNKAQPLHPTAK